jgi:manganese transport protein
MPSHTMSRKTEQSASEVLEGRSRKGLLRRLLPFIGPAFIASIAYIDPGNFATNIQSGAQYGYILLWVIVASNLMAMLIQALSAKLGIATGRNLAELCAGEFRRPVSLGLWVGMELASMATDLAEFLGAAVGFNLLLGVPLWIAGFLTAIATFVILGLERFGFRPLEAVISAFVGVISLSYLVELIIVKPDWGSVLPNAVIPQFQGNESIILSVGILGATVMPHVIFLHSALTQNRIIGHGDAQKRRLFRYELVDVSVAMGVAGLVNGAMLVMAAGTFFQHGEHGVGTLEQAYKTLQPLLGNASGWLFGIALLASGLSSSSVGTQAGQVIMEGFIHRKIPVWLRRLITMVPSLAVIIIGLDPTRTLVISQVVLSFCLPMALIPLVIFTNRRDLMGALVNRTYTKILIILVTAIIIGLNVYLLYGVLAGTGG